MSFVDELKETSESVNFGKFMPFDEDMSYRGFYHIKFGEVSLSIQASFGHYCTPRKTLKDLNDYTSMEFALIKDGEFISVTDILPDFPRLEEIEEYHDAVYGFVPVELIEELYQDLKRERRT